MYGLSRELSTSILNRVLDPTKFNSVNVESETEPYFNVRIVELYDYSEEYFRQNNIPVEPLIFQDSINIISEVLQDCKPVLSLAANINLVLDGDPILTNSSVDVKQLAYSEFYNYTKSTDNLNRIKQKEYISDRLGAQNYSLSAGDITLLNTPQKPWRNLLNRHTVAVNDRHASVTYSKSLDKIGGFFTPKNTGLLTFYSHKPVLNITDPTAVSSNIQDVYKHGNSVWSNTTNNPIDHFEDVTWVKADISNGALFGDLVNTRDHAKFVGYTSVDEVNKFPRQGVSRSTDALGFFTGPRNSEWSHEDVFPVDRQYEFDIDSRQEKMLVGHRSLYKWRTDIFGNEYALYKKIQPERGPFDVGLDDIIEFEASPKCEVLDGGNSLRQDKDQYDETVITDIFEGGRIGGFDPKVEQYLIPVPFPDYRRMIDVDENGEPVFEEWNTTYYGISPVVEREQTVPELTPIMYHGFAPDVEYDRQAYCGFFTDDICGRLHPEIKECAIVDNYGFNVYTEEVQGSDNFQSSNYWTGSGDAFEEYINPHFEEYNEDFGFTSFGMENELDFEIIEGPNIDGLYFSTEICDNLEGDFNYTQESETYFDQSLEIGKTEYSDEPEKSMLQPVTLYDQKCKLGGAGFFRSYNGSKLLPLHEALINVVGDFDYLEGDEYDMFKQDIIDGNIIDLDVVYDVMIIETERHIFIEKINFDAENSVILRTGTTNIFMKLTGSNPAIERSIGHFFHERNNELVFGKLVAEETESGSTFVYPVMYVVDLNTLKYKQAHPNKHYKEETFDLFKFTGDLEKYSIEHVDCPVLSFNDNTNVYNLSYSARLADGDMTKYTIFSFDYRQGQYNMKLKDSYAYHADEVTRYVPEGDEWSDRIDSKTIKLFPDESMRPSTDGGSLHTSRQDSIQSMIGHPLSGYKFDLTIETKTIPVSFSLDEFKINRIIFDPGDGTEPYINDRIIDDGLQALTFDLTELPDPSDFGDPRRLGFNHEYLFDKSEPHTYKAKVTAIYSNFMTATYNIDIETVPYTVESGFDGAKLIDSKLFTDVEGKDRQLLIIETQNPRYVTNVIVDRNNGANNIVDGYVDGSRYVGPGHTGRDGRLMTGDAPTPLARPVTVTPEYPIVDIEPFDRSGYYPLYGNPKSARSASPTPNLEHETQGTVGYHTHLINGRPYYMPNGLPEGWYWHGDFAGVGIQSAWNADGPVVDMNYTQFMSQNTVFTSNQAPTPAPDPVQDNTPTYTPPTSTPTYTPPTNTPTSGTSQNNNSTTSGSSYY